MNKGKRSKVKIKTCLDNYPEKYAWQCAECGNWFVSRGEAETCSDRNHVKYKKFSVETYYGPKISIVSAICEKKILEKLNAEIL